MAWEIDFTAQAEAWYLSLRPEVQQRTAAAFDLLAERGPGLGRPAVDSIKGSRHHNLKELRSGSQRALFAFDRDRRAIVLFGGDKRGDWDRFYERALPVAERGYDEHQRSKGGGGRSWRELGAGGRSAVSGR